MNKKLNVSGLESELTGSAFFQPPASSVKPSPEDPTLATGELRVPTEESKAPHEQAPSRASKPASMLASEQGVEAIRKTVKTPGKEVSFVRLTLAEKTELADIVYTYRRQGVRTSENEINRIAVNFMLEDYRANGENSFLARVLAALAA